MSLAALLDRAEADFTEAGIETPRVDAELLAAWMLGISRGELQSGLITDSIEFDEAQTLQFEALAARRAAREPLQHLTGVAHFRNITITSLWVSVLIQNTFNDGIFQHAQNRIVLDLSFWIRRGLNLFVERTLFIRIQLIEYCRSKSAAR
jgi:hypothetical protein